MDRLCIGFRFHVPSDIKRVISISWFSTEKLNQTQQKQTCIRNNIYYYTKLTHTKLKPGLVASYDLRPGNRTDLFCKE